MVRFGEATEAPLLEQIKAVIHSYPHVPGAVFEQRRHLTTRKTIPRANGRDASVRDGVE